MHNFKKLVCPKCKAKLENNKNKLSCKPCKLEFPLVNSTIAPFFSEPDAAIARAYVSCYRSVKRLSSQNAELTKTLKTSKRKKQLLPLLKAYLDNQAFFKVWMRKLQTLVNPEKLIQAIDENQGRQNYGYNYSYITRDWTRENELQINRKIKDIRKALAGKKPGGDAMFLGFGTGRFLTELAADFNKIFGIDSSFGQIAQFNTLLKKPINYWQINTKNQLAKENIFKKLTAEIPHDLAAKAQKINYSWADALNMPFKNNSFDWLLSIYFTDVTPLPKLITEIKRVLKPGGYFLHFGPLHYHFNDLEHHYSYVEFSEYFVKNGFEIIYDSTSEPEIDEIDKTSLLLPMNFIDKVLLLRQRKNEPESKNSS